MPLSDATEALVRQDLILYGEAYEIVDRDGSRTRLDPALIVKHRRVRKVRPPMSDLTTKDMRCYCQDCEARTQETYRLYGHCANCGHKLIGVFRKGDGHGWGQECPYCEVDDLRWGGLVGDIADE